ncbi:hypothetical protein FA15DRAFT_701372 [Coprinopsis marcescibilis]|uniref:MATH domain-containing protein n=1 Tax=Coprinopsis marcescibilis TaxID=230819 RepID=A0A5C3L5F9_COPMA|nr:hypothetical protein FA15DRAFT_701372 [Coprinopsis marcescibilis]
MDVDSESQEHTCVTFEWKIKGLRSLFESTKGEAKSKVTKSGKFDNGRWQVLFYANAGLAKDPACPDGYVSLYLSCDPTPEEKEAGLVDSGRWVREGAYKFSFELRNLDRNQLYGTKEATNHSFSSRTANWGWAQFARRDTIYYNCPPNRAQDALLIICNVMSSPRKPPPPPIYPHLPTSIALLDTIGSLLDDPLYSDVQFVFPRGQKSNNPRRIFASKKMLARVEYFSTMFASGFAEGTISLSPETSKLVAVPISRTASEASRWADEFEDSDEDTEDVTDTSSFIEAVYVPNEESSFSGVGATSNKGDGVSTESFKLRSRPASPSDVSEVRSESAAPSEATQKEEMPGPSKTVIIVKDVAYRTYKALLYWLYTGQIVFAPLSSSFHNNLSRSTSETSSLGSQAAPGADGGSQQPGSRRVEPPASSRYEWIKNWAREFPNRPEPCSAKAVYRVADKIDIPELKERAAQHIIKSLTVDNIGFEIFSPFSATFDEIRKVEITFFLNHWQQIRSSESMSEVWRQIRTGRHPGFEEVWPLITQSLEFKPSPHTPSSAHSLPFKHVDNL